MEPVAWAELCHDVLRHTHARWLRGNVALRSVCRAWRDALHDDRTGDPACFATSPGLLAWALACGMPPKGRAWRCMASQGTPELLHMLVHHSPRIPIDVCSTAAMARNLPVVLAAVRLGLPCHPWVSAAFATHGDAGAVLALHRAGVRVSHEVFSEAARRGHTHVMRMVVARGFPMNVKDAVCCAASAGAIAALQWLRERCWQDTVHEALTAAITCGQFQTLRWLVQHGRCGRLRLYHADLAAKYARGTAMHAWIQRMPLVP